MLRGSGLKQWNSTQIKLNFCGVVVVGHLENTITLSGLGVVLEAVVSDLWTFRVTASAEGCSSAFLKFAI